MKNILRLLKKESKKPKPKSCEGCIHFQRNRFKRKHCNAPYEQTCNNIGHLFYQIHIKMEND